MNMMLFAMVAALAVGLFGQRFAHREMRLVVIIATALTVIYFVRPAYMS